MRLTIKPWLLHGAGHAPDAEYVERFWLPLIGPTAFVTLRHLAHRIADQPDGLMFETATLCTQLGIGSGEGPRAPLRRALTRLERFGLAQHADAPIVIVRDRIPWLSPRLEQRLDPSLRAAHGVARAYARSR